MTNEQIILNVRLQLMQDGKIGSTGRYFEIADENGEMRKIPEPEEIHSYSRWHEYGYSVKKGEKAVAKIEIWKCATSKKQEEADGEENEEKEQMFKKVAFFFAPSQVEPLREEKR